jgi:hypothetical protein
MVAHEVTVGSWHGVVGHLLLAHGAYLSVGYGFLGQKSKICVLGNFWSIFGHRSMAMLVRWVTMLGHGDDGQSGSCYGVAGNL